MNRGEITGNFFGVSHEDVGMPFRPKTIMKRNNRKNISMIDELVNVNNTENNDALNTANFNYFDPATASYAGTNIEKISQPKRGFENSRLDFDAVNIKKNPTAQLERFPNLTDDVNEVFDEKLHNISTHDTDYLNKISCNMFANIAGNSCVNFSVFPIGIMATLIENDPNIKQILKKINTQEINHAFRSFPNDHYIVSRLSAIIALNPKSLSNTFGFYDDNENIVIDFPLKHPEFAIGFIKSKNDKPAQITPKMFDYYTMNLKKTKCNIYCPAFRIVNKLDTNQTLMALGIIKKTNIRYMQSIYIESQENIIIKNSTMNNNVDLSEHFIFYIRYVPNNLLLVLGRVGELQT